MTTFSVTGLLHNPLRGFLNPIEPALHKLMLLDRLLHLYGAAGTLERLLRLLDIRYQFGGEGLEAIPRSGPVVLVANHPFGLLEGAILAAALPEFRSDVRILANSVLAFFPELRERCIFVDPFGKRDSVPSNAAALKECIAWLQGGGLLVTFPAGEVARFDWRRGAISDPQWNPAIARIAQKTGAAVVPVYFQGANSLAFQVAGAVHPGIRTMSLPRELLNKRGRCFRIRVGRPVAPETLRGFEDSRAAVEYLRCRTYLMGWSGTPGNPIQRLAPAFHFPSRKPAAVVPTMPAARLAREIAQLKPAQMLCENQELAAFVASASEMPEVLREIGRLREISFRGAGEGTGRPIDLDRFDAHYLHLVLWNRRAEEVVGAYRLGPTPDILPRYGMRGLYTSTLFRFRKDLFDALGPAIELGRSFIRPEYQRQYAPLMLLWKGIFRYVASRPECGILFGGVSVSDKYHPVSRRLIARFLDGHRVESLARLVSPRRPYRAEVEVPRHIGSVNRVPATIEDVSALVSDIEADGKGVPVLVKQYLKTGGKLLGFTVDPRFSNTLDALIMVDLRTAPRGLLERYLGKREATAFLLSQARPALAPPPVRSQMPPYRDECHGHEDSD